MMPPLLLSLLFLLPLLSCPRASATLLVSSQRYLLDTALQAPSVLAFNSLVVGTLDVGAAISVMQAQRSSDATEIAKLHATVQQQAGNITQLQATVLAQASLLQSHSDALAALTARMLAAESLTPASSSLVSSVISLQSQVSGLSTDSQSLTARVAAAEQLTPASSSLVTTVLDLKSRVTSAEQLTPTSSSPLVTSVLSSATQLSLLLTESGLNSATLKEHVQLLQALSNSSDLAGTVAQLVVSEAQLSTTVNQMQATEQQMRSDITSLSAREDQSCRQLAALNSSLTQQAATATAFSLRLTSTETNISTLSTRMSAAELAVIALTSRVAAEESLSVSLQSRMSTAETNVTELATRLAADESTSVSNSASILSRMSNAETAATQLASRVSAAESLTGGTLLASTVAVHTDQIAALQAANSSSVSVTSALAARLVASESAAISLTARVAAAESLTGGTILAQTAALNAAQILALQLQNSSTISAAAALTMRVSAVEGAVTSLSQRSVSQTILITQLQVANSSISDAAAALTSRVSAAEASLVSISATSMLHASQLSSLQNSNSSLYASLLSISARLLAVEQLSPPSATSIQPTILYSTLTDLLSFAGQSQLVTAVRQQQGWIAAINETTAAICNTPSSSCNLCVAISLTVLGAGTVQQSPTGCVAGSFVAGSTVTLIAVSTLNSTFDSWSVGISSNSSTVSFIMPATPLSLTASFLFCYPLNVSVAVGGGASSVSSTQPSNSVGCSAGRFIAGAIVQITALPATDYVFSTWSGASSAAAASLSFSMPSSAATLSANFLACWPLSVSVAAGGGTGAVATLPTSSVGCASGKFFAGTTVQVTATPSGSSGLAAWTGALASYSALVVLYSMPSSSATATAQFGVPCSLDIPSTSTISITVSRNISYQMWGGQCCNWSAEHLVLV
jgi:hypothetical protein